MIQYANKADLVFERLRDMIYSGEMPQGDTFSAIDLSRQLGVSRTPVNEALKRLADRNLVTILPNVGFQVAVIRREDVRDLTHLKLILEQTAIRWIRDRAIEVDYARLRQLNDRIADAIRAEDRSRYAETVRAFHLEFIGSAHSPPLTDTFTGTWEWSGWEDTALQEVTDDLLAQCKEHQALLDAMERGDFDTALEVSRLHADTLLEFFNRNGKMEEQ